jgi:hypothetical protein
MFIRRSTYTALLRELADLREAKARAETLADLLRIQLNTTAHELATLKAERTGQRHLVPKLEKPVSSVDDYAQGVVSFEDMGDEEAHRLGITFNDDGTVKYS